jgi:hypothetical protein
VIAALAAIVLAGGTGDHRRTDVAFVPRAAKPRRREQADTVIELQVVFAERQPTLDPGWLLAQSFANLEEIP